MYMIETVHKMGRWAHAGAWWLRRASLKETSDLGHRFAPSALTLRRCQTFRQEMPSRRDGGVEVEMHCAGFLQSSKYPIIRPPMHSQDCREVGDLRRVAATLCDKIYKTALSLLEHFNVSLH